MIGEAEGLIHLHDRRYQQLFAKRNEEKHDAPRAAIEKSSRKILQSLSFISDSFLSDQCRSSMAPFALVSLQTNVSERRKQHEQGHPPLPPRHRIPIKTSQHPTSVHPNLWRPHLRHRSCDLPLAIVVLDAVRVLPSTTAVALVLVSFRRGSGSRDVGRVDRVDFVGSRVVRSVPVEHELLVGRLASLTISKLVGVLQGREGRRNGPCACLAPELRGTSSR